MPRIKREIENIHIRAKSEKEAKQEARKTLGSATTNGLMKDWNPKGPEVVILREPETKKIFFATYVSNELVRLETSKGFVQGMKYLAFKHTLDECHTKLADWEIIGRGASREELINAGRQQ